MSSEGKIKIMMNMLISAPRLMSRHMLCKSSMRDIIETPIVAAKNVSPLESMLWLQFSTA